MKLNADHVTGLLVALAISLILNLPQLSNVPRGEWSYPDITIESSDEVYYQGRIREVMDGHWSVGHVYLFEGRDQFYPLGVLSEQILGSIGRIFGISLKAVSIGGDIVLPFLLAMLVWIGVRHLLPDRRWRALLLCLVFLGSSIVFWKRPVSPQMMSVPFFLWLGLFLHPKRSEPAFAAPRAVLAGLMLFSYPFHWTFVFGAEGLLLLADLLERRTSALRRIASTVLPLLPFLAFFAWQNLHVSDPQAYAETLVRLGKIDSHWPTGPRHQLTLLCLLALVSWRAWMRGQRQQWCDQWHRNKSMILLLLAGLAMFNLPVVLGWEAEFSSHYGKILHTVVWLCALWLVSSWLRGRKTGAVRWLEGATLVACFAVILWQTAVASRDASIAFREAALPPAQREDEAALFAALNALPGEQVILADNHVGRMLTLYTRHYPFFTSDTHLGPVRNAELRTRAAVQHLVWPEDAVIGPRSLFGSHHLNAALHARQVCRLFAFLRQNGTVCTADPLAFLPPEWNAFHTSPPPSPPSALTTLRDTHVTYVVLKTLPAWLEENTEKTGEAGGYGIWTLRQR